MLKLRTWMTIDDYIKGKALMDLDKEELVERHIQKLDQAV